MAALPRQMRATQLNHAVAGHGTEVTLLTFCTAKPDAQTSAAIHIDNLLKLIDNRISSRRYFAAESKFANFPRLIRRLAICYRVKRFRMLLRRALISTHSDL
jgi:hypothetical protein